MADGAVHLVDRVLPLAADYRQWTLSFPRWLRIRLLRDKALTSEVLAPPDDDLRELALGFDDL